MTSLLTSRFSLLASRLSLFALLLSACATPTPLAPTATPNATARAATPTVPNGTGGSETRPDATSTPSPTPVPIELIVCQTDEPSSLYLYDSDSAARAGIFDALFDGPIDSVGYAYQPVILDSLPSLENGGATLSEVTVSPGDVVADAARGTTTPLTAGVTLAQLDGTRLVYTGTAPAQTVQVSAVFKLKPGLVWADGQPLTAADSVFSFQIASDPRTPISKYLLDRTASYDAVDDLTARWTGLPGWLDSQFFLRFWTPLPRHLYGTIPAAQLLTNADAAEHPLGWGAFVLSEWQKGDHLTLARNPLYFRAAEGLPRVDKITFRFGLAPEQIVSELLAGRCDIGADNADLTGQVEALLKAQTAGTLAPQFVSTTAFEHLDFGIASAEDYDRSAGASLFADARLRQAFAYCLNRPALVDEFFHGLAEVPDVYLPRAHPLAQAAAGQVAVYPFDPARGQALLDELGWRDGNADGVRENGKRKLSLAYVSGPPENAFRAEMMDWMAAQVKTNCAIELRPALTALDELYAPWPSGLLFGRRFDVGQFPWRAGSEPPCELYLTEAIPSDQNPGGANNTGYSNPAFDAACRAAKSALEAAPRTAKHAEAEIIFSQDLPSLPLYFRFKTGVARPGIGGYAVDPTANSDLWNVEALSK